MAIKNTKVPQNVFGPYQHYMFCGCSIRSFSLNGGYNQQQSNLTVQLVQETRSVPAGCDAKIYYDKHLNQQTTTAADPGFTYPDIGSPAYFRVADFEFSGLVQRRSENRDASGNPVFVVTLVDPREILSNAEAIIGDYAGSVGNVTNAFNVFGYMERFGDVCPETVINGATFGTPAGGFGGALVNSNGMQWNRIRDGIRILTSAFPKVSNQFSPNGRILFRGAQPATQGYGVIKHDKFDINIPVDFANHTGYLNEYFLDLTDMPTTPSFFRLGGTSLSVLDMVDQVCSASGCDYYIELMPVKIGNTVYKFIKIRTVSRATQPALGSIASFLNSADCYVSNSKGQELRNEPTSSILSGGFKQTVFQLEQDTNEIKPFFGLDDNGDAIIATTTSKVTRVDDDGNSYMSTVYRIPVSLTELNTSLFTPLGSSSTTLWEEELLMAQAGFDSWLGYAMLNTPIGTLMNTAYGGIVGVAGAFAEAHELAKRLEGGKGFPKHIIGGAPGAGRFPADSKERDLQKIFEFVSGIANEYYGKKFMVTLPHTCVKADLESGNLVYTEEPSSDGGWTDESSVIGANNPSDLLTFLSDDVGKVLPFVRFDTASSIDIFDFNSDNFGVADGDLFVKASVDPTIVFTEFSSQTGPHAVITIDEVAKQRTLTKQFAEAFNGLVGILQDKDGTALGAEEIIENLKELANKLGVGALALAEYKQAKIPNAVAVPLKSNISRYGTFVVRGPAGGVNVTVDDGLVPWEYGSTAQMNAAGAALVGDSLTFMQVAEMGNITVPGYPVVPLGAELGAINGGAFGAGRHLLEVRDLLSDNFQDTVAGDQQPTAISWYRTNTAGQWTGLYGPNITGIDVQVGKQGVQTTYNMRTFTPKINRFNKENADRMRTIGKRLNRLAASINKGIGRGAKIDAATQRFISSRANAAAAAAAEKGKEPPKDGLGTPVEILAGQIASWDTNFGDDDSAYRNTYVGAVKARDFHTESENQYASKAFMSLDGLLRPISMDGDGDLPRYYQSLSNNAGRASSIPPEPPIAGGSGVQIDINYLHPFVNPDNVTGNDRHLKHSSSSDTSNRNAHDVDILARGDSKGESPSVQLSQDAINDGTFTSTGYSGYVEDYRALALRGPLIIHGWGYGLDGKPIPNEADSEGAIGSNGAANGEFVSTSLQDTFLPDWLRKPHTWPVGPVDLRFDRDRGVWTVPTSFRICHATLDATLSPGGSALCTIINGPTVYDSSGSSVTKQVTVFDEDMLGSGLANGDKVTIYWDGYNEKYYLLSGESLLGGGGGGGSQLLYSAVSGDNGYVTAQTTNDELQFVGLSGLRTEVIQNAEFTQVQIADTGSRLTQIITDNGVTVFDQRSDTLTLVGGTGCSVAAQGKQISINVTPGGDSSPSGNYYTTISADTNQTFATSEEATLNLVGGSGITTTASSDTVTFDVNLVGGTGIQTTIGGGDVVQLDLIGTGGLPAALPYYQDIILNYDDLSDPGTTKQVITGVTVDPGEVLIYMWYDLTTLFTDGANPSVLLTFGDDFDDNAFLSSVEVGDTTKGSVLTGIYRFDGSYFGMPYTPETNELAGGTRTLEFNVTSSVNLDTLTAGQLKVRIFRVDNPY